MNKSMPFDERRDVVAHAEGDIHRGPTGLLEQHSWTTIRRSPLLTRHGVRNLNGPRMDGWDHNGHRRQCTHDLTLPHDETRRVDGQLVTMRYRKCGFCGLVIE